MKLPVIAVVTTVLILAMQVVVSRPALAATNTLSSVASVDGNSGFYKCGFQGYVTTTSSSTTVSSVYLYFTETTGMEGGASYLQQQSGNNLVWDYNGKSTYLWHSGYSTGVYTIALVSSGGPPTTVTSSTLSWVSGS